MYIAMYSAMAKEKGPIRKAGQRLRIALKKGKRTVDAVDNTYSGKVTDMYMGKEDNPRSYVDNPVGGTAAGLAALYLGGTPMSARGQEGTAPGAAYTSAAAKYGAPVAGVALAAKGIADMTGFGSQADQPEQHTLPM